MDTCGCVIPGEGHGFQPPRAQADGQGQEGPRGAAVVSVASGWLVPALVRDSTQEFPNWEASSPVFMVSPGAPSHPAWGLASSI